MILCVRNLKIDMKKIFLCTFVPLVCILPTFSFANPLVDPIPPIDWCVNHCFDCQTNSKKAKDGDCFKCHYTNDELKSECTKIDEIHQANNPQSQANVEQPQANAEQPQANAEQPQTNTEQPQTNTEQPQANAVQPKEETDSTVRKPAGRCSVTPYLPSSTSIAWLIMILISLGLLIHLRRLEK